MQSEAVSVGIPENQIRDLLVERGKTHVSQLQGDVGQTYNTRNPIEREWRERPVPESLWRPRAARD